jgi:integrative and conjugative element protein (TIGR02256 family)
MAESPARTPLPVVLPNRLVSMLPVWLPHRCVLAARPAWTIPVPYRTFKRNSAMHGSRCTRRRIDVRFCGLACEGRGGYWSHKGVVISAVTGPGPNARHARRHFDADHMWQAAAIADYYEKSGRRETYLGDWHSHPGAMNPNLSPLDRLAVRKIINSPAARAPTPLMGIIYGAPDENRGVGIWRGRLQRRSILWPRLVLDRLELAGESGSE